MADPKMVRTVSFGELFSLAKEGALSNLGLHVLMDTGTHGGSSLTNRRGRWVHRVSLANGLDLFWLHARFSLQQRLGSAVDDRIFEMLDEH
jgi:hypothetical protein